MGQLGDKQDRLGRQGALQGAILEFRKVSPIGGEDWADFALRAHRHISILNRG